MYLLHIVVGVICSPRLVVWLSGCRALLVVLLFASRIAAQSTILPCSRSAALCDEPIPLKEAREVYSDIHNAVGEKGKILNK